MAGRGRVPAVAIELSEGERAELEGLSRRRRTAQGLARRAQMVLLAAGGLENKEIAAQLGSDPGTVGKWRRRFAARRLDGLYDEPRPGAPRQIGDDAIAETVRRTLEETPPDASHWSLRGMARAMGYAPSTIHRIWRAFGLQPHRSETFKLSTDPKFAEKVEDIVGLYLAPPERALVLCVDEKSQIRRGVHRSLRELEDAIHRYIATVNAAPKPFRWIRSADAILASVQRFCIRTLDTAHQQRLMGTTSESGH